jgi:hypothetical protein
MDLVLANFLNMDMFVYVTTKTHITKPCLMTNRSFGLAT